MRSKSLLIGSAVALAAATGAAQAADTVVYAAQPAPEPVEYVRVCDAYGAGFFYIPGTETCLKIGGLFRYEIVGNPTTSATYPDTGYHKFARFQLNVDARSETALGTLRGYAELRADWAWGLYAVPGAASGAAASTALGYNMSAYPNQVYIELQQSMGTWRLGKSDTPYATFAGYGAYDHYDGSYAFNNSGVLSYTYTGGNGLSVVLAAVEDKGDVDWAPNFEGGAKFAQGWGDVGAIVGYDEGASNWGVKGFAHFSFNSMFSGGVMVMYSSGPSVYAISQPLSGGVSPWAVLAFAKAKFTPAVAATAHFEWFSAPTAGATEYEINGGLELTPVTNLKVSPQVQYDWGHGAHSWAWVIRADRTF